MTRELTVPVDYLAAREALAAACPAPRRSQIDDTLFRRADGALARLRRQDTVTRLSCTRPDLELPEPPETIVLDNDASRRLLDLLGFEAVDRVRLARETWRSCQYFVHLDRVEGLGDFITLQAERGRYPAATYRKIALKYLKSLGIEPAWEGVDKAEALPYTASITSAASAPS
jgi:adenylate cyclase class IV